jgi:glycosidase
MINIYQLFPRLFGNKNPETLPYGTISQNGCGKFMDISEEAIAAIRNLGITHIWLTGVIRHASLTSYKEFGIPESHPAVVKGRAGSPYAICDYYDVDPDLATDPANRMEEFGQLMNRIHAAGLKVLIDFVPNHLAREYKSIAKPAGVSDFGEHDDPTVSFTLHNNFYYLPGENFNAPLRPDDPFANSSSYHEFPAKVTGNDCFTASPSLNDWFETVKLNYGYVPYSHEFSETSEIPDTWRKMLHILEYWSALGVDGFRVDMTEMVPAAFFSWLIRNLKAEFPRLIFIAEIYQPNLYRRFLDAGFDYLYDKVGMYNRLEDVLKHGHAAESISICWKMLDGLDDKMLRFMENHDEIRLASKHFVNDSYTGLPAVTIAALMHRGPFMIYNGQETGEKAEGSPGYSGDDGRTTLFDYASMPAHQQWMGDGSFDGKRLSTDQHKLFDFYQKILHLRLENEAISHGAFYDLMWANPWYTDFDPRFVYAFLRFTENEKLLIVVNFHKTESRRMRLNIPEDAIQSAGLSAHNQDFWIAENLFNPKKSVVFDPESLSSEGIQLTLSPLESAIYRLHPTNPVL